MNKAKISVVGCGYWGKNFVRNFAGLGNLESICDENQECLKSISNQYQVPIRTFDQIIKSDVDGIVISAPPAHHYRLARKSLEAGKHVFVEKPLTMNVEHAQKLQKVSLQTGKVLMVGHLLQYHPAFLKLKELINQGKLGRIHHIYSYRVNLGSFRHKENVFWDLAPHDISMILSLTNDLPEKVYTRGSCNYNPFIYDTILADLSFKNGIKAHIFVSWLHSLKEQRFVVVGEHGMAVFDDCLPWTEKLKIYPHEINFINELVHFSKADVETIPLEDAEPLKLECQHFIKCIQNNQKSITDGFEGIQVLKVLEAVQQRLDIM